MKFRFTEHAKHRLFLERDISVDSVKAVIREPDSVRHLPDGMVKCVRKLEKGDLTVVYFRDKGTYVIVTAYFK